MTKYRPNEEQVWRTIPLKLLPVSEQQYTTKWAESTYSYRCLFDTSVTSHYSKNDTEVEEWRLKALQLMKEIKQIGLAQGRLEIVNLARNHYGMRMPNAPSCKPTTIDDVMLIIEDKNWYQDNTPFKHNIIYHLVYGLTRCGMNGWLLTQEQEWLRDNKLQYSTDEVGIRKTKLRGFVYSIMNSQFSNSTTKLFRTVMKRKYGEFITVRKPLYNLKQKYVYTEQTFLGGNGYIVTCIDTTIHHQNIPTDTVEDVGVKWIQACQDEGTLLPQIHDLLDELYVPPKQHSEDINCVVRDNDINNTLTMGAINNNCSIAKTRKEPRMRLQTWNQTNKLNDPGTSSYLHIILQYAMNYAFIYHNNICFTLFCFCCIYRYS